MKPTLSSILPAVLLVVSTCALADAHKQVVGATEMVHIGEANLTLKARVDTGAKTSSIHAERIEVDSSGNARGKPISFYLVSKDGQSRKISTRVSSVVKVRTADHSERRYVVPLRMTWNGVTKTVLVTLNDRKSMEYRLLLGRNWLRGDFLVDVDKNNED